MRWIDFDYEIEEVAKKFRNIEVDSQTQSQIDDLGHQPKKVVELDCLRYNITLNRFIPKSLNIVCNLVNHFGNDENKSHDKKYWDGMTEVDQWLRSSLKEVCWTSVT